MSKKHVKECNAPQGPKWTTKNLHIQYKYNIYLVTSSVWGCTTAVPFFLEAECRTLNSNLPTQNSHTLICIIGYHWDTSHTHILNEYSFVVSVWVSLIITMLHPRCLCHSFSGCFKVSSSGHLATSTALYQPSLWQQELILICPTAFFCHCL